MTPGSKNASDLLPSLPPGAEILIIRLRSLGDMVLLTPALAAVHEWRPDLRLCVLVQPRYAAVLEGNPAVSEILQFTDFVSGARRVRSRRFPITFNQHGGPTSAFLTAAIGSRARVCWDHCQFPFLYNVLVPYPAAASGHAGVHTVEHRMEQFYYTGLPRGPIPRTQVFPKERTIAWVREKLKQQGINEGQPYVVVHPGAAYATKRWPTEKFSALSTWLATNYSICPVFILGPDDGEVAGAVRRCLVPPAILFDSFGVDELMALSSEARFFVGNDTGTTHLAVAASCPVVVVFGSSSPIVWGPWQAPHRVVVNDFPCRPCPGDRCYAFDEPRCILSVSLSQVQEACETLLATTARAGPTGIRSG